ncbi:MAG: hypothetical protein L0Z62_12245 [Gemmataceae bacterium]|nr:hypothetical protein [Gemmataceae bacterium]
MSLQSWLQIGHLINHQATVAEVRNLLGVVDRELADAGVSGLSDDGRFTHAYDAALLLCKLALHASGFEVQKRAPGHHALWINSLEFTLGDTHKATVIHLSKSSKLRNTTLYDHTGVVQKQDADDLLEAARQLRTDVLNWLRSQQPALMPSGY